MDRDMHKETVREAFARREREKVPMPPKDKDRKAEALEQISAALVRIANVLEKEDAPQEQKTLDQAVEESLKDHL